MKDKLNAIREDIDKALAAVAKKHKLASLACKGAARYTTSTCTFTVEGVAAGGKSIEAQRYETNQKLLKLPPLGTTITHKGQTYVSTGLNTTGSKVYAKQVVTGKEYLFDIALFIHLAAASVAP